MVLCLKTWESRSLPGLQRAEGFLFTGRLTTEDGRQTSVIRPLFSVLRPLFIAGWSSPVARQAHNLKVTGSNPVPATKFNSALLQR